MGRGLSVKTKDRRGRVGKANRDTEEQLLRQILGSTSEDACARVRGVRRRRSVGPESGP